MATTTCPILRPTLEEFSNFYDYIRTLESKFHGTAGICKVIPPDGWYHRIYDMESLSKLVIKNPVRQLVNATKAGVYSTHLFDIKHMLVSDFVKFAKKNHCDDGASERERKFWRNLGSTSTWDDPIYGADMLGSLFGQDDASSWNLNKIDNMLRLLEADIPGVNSSMLYVGTWRSFFACHVEDVNLYSINYLHIGEPKSWYSVDSSYKQRFESMSDSFHPSDIIDCPEYLRHKTKLFSPKKLKEYGIPYTTAVQHPGEFIITFPGAYHEGFNHGFNIAEATNFATPGWIKLGKQAKVCQCMPWTVRINVERLETIYYRSIVTNGSSKYGGVIEDDISLSDEMIINMQHERELCFCKRRYAFDDDVTPSSDDNDGSYICKACLIQCHKRCLEEEVPGISILGLCHICYDIDIEPLSYDITPTSSSSRTPTTKTRQPKIKKPSCYSQGTQTMSPAELQADYIRLLQAHNYDNVSLTSAAPVPSQLSYQPNKHIDMQPSTHSKHDHDAMALHDKQPSAPSIPSSSLLSYMKSFQHIQHKNILCTPTNIIRHQEVSPTHTHDILSSPPLYDGPTMKKAKLEVKEKVMVMVPGADDPVYGTLVDMNGKLGRFHEKGARRVADMWIPLSQMERVKDGDRDSSIKHPLNSSNLISNISAHKPAISRSNPNNNPVPKARSAIDSISLSSLSKHTAHEIVSTSSSSDRDVDLIYDTDIMFIAHADVVASEYAVIGPDSNSSHYH